MKKINIEITGKTIKAELNNTGTAKKIYNALPIESTISRWGEEIYFGIDVESDLEEGTEILDEGSLAFWPPGNAFCIFFGPTPASTDGKPRAAGPVTVIGSVLKKTDFKSLRNTSDGQPIKIRR